MDELTSQSATTAINNIGNYVAAGNFGRRSYRYNKKLYEMQRDDNLKMWNLQNEYNSPKQQMARLIEGGLNPHLVYGNGADATAGAISNGSPSAPNIPSPQMETIPPSSFMMQYDVELKKQTLDNLKAQNTVISNEALLKAAQTLGIIQTTERGKFDLGFESELREVSAEARREALRNLKVGITSTTDANRRANELHPGSVKEQVGRIALQDMQQAKGREEIKEIQKKIELMNQSKDMNQFEIDLNKRGFTKSDDVKYRMANKIWDAMMDGMGIKEAVDKARKEIETLGKKAQNATKSYYDKWKNIGDTSGYSNWQKRIFSQPGVRKPG